MTTLDWAYLWILFLATVNVLQFAQHWAAHHAGTVYESPEADREEP